MCLGSHTKRRRREVGRSLAEPSRAGDAFQRPLRSRFQARLTPGVAMTSAVKSSRKNSYEVF
jgi:hypothetical protein